MEDDEKLKLMERVLLMAETARHDITNHLMVATGYVELAINMSDNPRQMKYLDESLKALELINQELEFSRVYEKIGTSEPQWQSIGDIDILGSSKIKIDNQCEGLLVCADSLISRVFYNLRDNSLKHGKATKAKLFFVQGQDSQTLKIVWEDNGSGIPFDMKERVFIKGFGTNSGLGLFLIREILAITGITIIENGIPGKGALFEMTVPETLFKFTEG